MVTKSKKMPNKQTLTYSQAATEVEKILQSIENQALDVDQLTEQLKRASELIRFCKKRLRATEAEVDQVLKELEDQDGVTNS